MAAGLINAVPSCADLLASVIAEAERSIGKRLAIRAGR